MKKIFVSILFAITILSLGLVAGGNAEFDAAAEAANDEQLVRQSLVLPWEPAFLIEEDDSSYQTTWAYGSCTQTCAPCRTNSDCPPFFGFPQKCHQYCP